MFLISDTMLFSNWKLQRYNLSDTFVNVRIAVGTWKKKFFFWSQTRKRSFSQQNHPPPQPVCKSITEPKKYDILFQPFTRNLSFNWKRFDETLCLPFKTSPTYVNIVFASKSRSQWHAPTYVHTGWCWEEYENASYIVLKLLHLYQVMSWGKLTTVFFFEMSSVTNYCPELSSHSLPVCR
jgi:hypothetical protein